MLAKAVEAAGATIINTGIGWHEARVPTIATSVPRRAFAFVTAKLMGQVGVPLIASNRINTPEVAEQVLAEGCADMVSMARPFLADSQFVAKAAAGRARDIAPCIACNQACLDHTFAGKVSSCLVNPRACHETELEMAPSAVPRRIAVVGAGAAGMAAAITAAGRGHDVTLFERDGRVGGQLNLARQVPGKEEFHGLVEWFAGQLSASGVALRLGHAAEPGDLDGFDAVVIATGVRPRDPGIPVTGTTRVAGYADVLSGRIVAGPRVAVVGAGGIGFDVAAFLVDDGAQLAEDAAAWQTEWGVADPGTARGGLAPDGPHPSPPARAVTLLQRKAEKPGKRLGKTTGWIHRAHLKAKGVRMLAGVDYRAVTNDGLAVVHDGRETVIAADTVVLCAGQESERSLAERLVAAGRDVHVIGGADLALELDAKRAIDAGMRLGARL
jgi:2,4-dienoyl-CoA reductase (NADPH2)